MGRIIQAECDCGFSVDCKLGGTRLDRHDRRFPHYCDRCGLVDANVANHPVRCPQCGTRHIIQYGGRDLAPLSFATLAWILKKLIVEIFALRTVSRPCGTEAHRQFDRVLTARKHLCPACKRMTLVFGGIVLLFD